MSAADSKLNLEQRLAKLLGISIDDDRDSVTDVLDSLIDIGDPDDVSEYLSSFVAAGDDDDAAGEDLHVFSRDVLKFKRGESISSADDDPKGKLAADAAAAAAMEADKKPKAKIIWDEAAAQREEIKRREAEAREEQRAERYRLTKKKEDEEKRRRMEAAVEAQRKQLELEEIRVEKAEAQRASLQKLAAEKMAYERKQKSEGAQNNKSSGTKKKEPPKRQRPNRPPKGTPKKKPCGCNGNKHKPLTNCLRCGRISCELEGINDYCHFCGYFIGDAFAGGDAKNDSAQKHKERLLEFDRTSAERTHIHDDQEDYFVASNSMWATQQEQEDAQDLEDARRKKLHEHKKLSLDLNF